MILRAASQRVPNVTICVEGSYLLIKPACLPRPVYDDFTAQLCAGLGRRIAFERPTRRICIRLVDAAVLVAVLARFPDLQKRIHHTAEPYVGEVVPAS